MEKERKSLKTSKLLLLAETWKGFEYLLASFFRKKKSK